MGDFDISKYTEQNQQPIKVSDSLSRYEQIKSQANILINSSKLNLIEKTKLSAIVAFWDKEDKDLEDKFKDLKEKILQNTKQELSKLLKEIKTNIKIFTQAISSKTQNKSLTGELTNVQVSTISDSGKTINKDIKEINKLNKNYKEIGLQEEDIFGLEQEYKNSLSQINLSNTEIDKLSENEINNKQIEFALSKLPETLSKIGNTGKILELLKYTHEEVDKNNFQSNKLQGLYSQVFNTINEYITNKLNQEVQSNPEQTKKNILEFANIITGRGSNIDDRYRNPELAEKLILELIDSGKINISKSVKLEDKDASYNEIKQTVSKFNQLKPEIRKTFLETIGFIDIIDNTGKIVDVSNIDKTDGTDNLTIEQKIKLSTLVRFEKNISKIKIPTGETKTYGHGNTEREVNSTRKIKNLNDFFATITEDSFKQAGNIMTKQAENSTQAYVDSFNINLVSTQSNARGNYEMKVQKDFQKDLGINGIDLELVKLYSSIAGVNSLGDKDIAGLKNVAKFGAVILSTIAVGIATGGVGAVAIISAAATATVASKLVYGQGYDNSKEAATDIVSDLAINVGFGLAGGATTAKVLKGTLITQLEKQVGKQAATQIVSSSIGKFGALTDDTLLEISKQTFSLTGKNIEKSTLKTMINTAIKTEGLQALGEGTAGTIGEYARQKYILGNKEVSLTQMIASGGIMIAIVAGGSGGIRTLGLKSKDMSDFDMSYLSPGNQIKNIDNFVEKFNSNGVKLSIEEQIIKNNLLIDLQKRKAELEKDFNGQISQINRNHPFLNIYTKLEKGGDFSMVIFNGIKKLNDNTSQAFADKVLDRFKAEIGLEYIDNKTGFLTQKLDTQVLQKRLNEIFEEEISKSKHKGKLKSNPLSLVSDSEKISPNLSQKEIFDKIAIQRSNLERKAMDLDGIKYLNFSETEKHYDNLLETYRYNGKHKEYFENLKKGEYYQIDNGVLTKSFLVDRVWKNERLRIVDENGDINLALITKVRKGELPQELNLVQDVQLLIKSAIANGEFIAPFKKEEGFFGGGDIISKNDLESYKKYLNGENVDISGLTSLNYKNALTKPHFYDKISEGEGFLAFLDIGGMGSENIKDFISRIRQANQKFSTEEEKRIFALTNSGDKMTQVFEDLNSQIRLYLEDLYPSQDINIYIGGDEVGIFISGAKKGIETETLIKSIFKHLSDESGVNCRLAQMDVEHSTSGVQAFDSLDKLANLSKALEKRLSELEQTNKLNGKYIEEYNQIKHFKTFIGEDGISYIQFLDNPFWKIKNNSIFELSEIIDGEKLRKNSVFTEYLDNMGIRKIQENLAANF